MHKICSKCKNELSLNQFQKDKSRKDGLYPFCKLCTNQIKRQSEAKIKEQDKDAWLARRRGYVKRYKSNHPDRAKRSERNTLLKRKYGITVEVYDQMAKQQNYSCAICKIPQDKTLHVDHNHLTDEVRGLLCNSCNMGIGYFKENLQSLFNAIEYLRKYNLCIK